MKVWLAQQLWANRSKVGYVIAGLVILVMLPLIIISPFLPDGGADDVRKYVDVSEQLEISWKEMVALDMALHNTIKRDPNDVARYFIDIHYEEYDAAHTRCIRKVKEKCVEEENVPERVTFSKDYTSKETIDRFLKQQGLDSLPLQDAFAKINATQGKRVTTMPKSFDSIQMDFEEDVRDMVNMALENDIYGEMFPDFIENSSFVPGACIVGEVSPNGNAKVNSDVERYSALINKYAVKYKMAAYVGIIKAMMMQESHGQGSDPLQSSEGKYALLLSPDTCKKGQQYGCIRNPEISIHAGVLEWRDAITKADGDIKVALQTYNFGPNFAKWIKSNGGEYTLELAEKYSQTVMAKYGQGLGTPKHALLVLQYYIDPGCKEDGSGADFTAIGDNNWLWPTKSKRITDVFSTIRDNGKRHNALDVGAIVPGKAGDPVWAIDKGICIKAQPINRGGYAVYIQHGPFISRYIHLQKFTIKSGQQVKRGQVIGYMGGTDYVNGKIIQGGYPVHLDFQIQFNSTPIDPAPFYKNVKLTYQLN